MTAFEFRSTKGKIMANSLTADYHQWHSVTGCVDHGGPHQICQGGGGSRLHATCPCCGLEPTTRPAPGVSGEGGTEHEARMILHDPENIDRYLMPHEYGVCDDCHKRQDADRANGKTSMQFGEYAKTPAAAN